MLEPMNCFYCLWFWESKVKTRFTSLKVLWGKGNIYQSVHPSPLFPLPRRPQPWTWTKILDFKWSKELSWREPLIWYLIPSSTEESAVRCGVYYLEEERCDLLLPLGVGAQIKVLCRGQRGQMPQSGPQNKILPTPSSKRKTVWR